MRKKKKKKKKKKEEEVNFHAFLISALDGCEWSASRLDPIIPEERTPSTH
jgi:hypothetical protein